MNSQSHENRTGLTFKISKRVFYDHCAMIGVKRSRDGVQIKGKAEVDSPYIPMFEAFRAELDEHHDRRERIIKASRDITASSKKT